MDLTGLEADILKIADRSGTMLIRAAGGGNYRHGGIMNSTMAQVEPIESSEDENGETRQVGATISLETRLMQTKTTVAFDLMKELTSGRVDIILAPRSVKADVLTGTEAESEGELKFGGRHLKIGGRLKYDRKASYLPARTEFRAPMSTITNFVL